MEGNIVDSVDETRSSIRRSSILPVTLYRIAQSATEGQDERGRRPTLKEKFDETNLSSTC